MDHKAFGNRISKTLSGTGVTGGPVTTWYVRDAQGNTLTTYEIKGVNIAANEQYIYGSSRLGAINRNLALNSSLSIGSTIIPGIGNVFDDEMYRGKKQYELSNHLGNVLTTVSDKKLPHSNGTSVDYYLADIVSEQDYTPFGMLMVGRSSSTGNYRYGFNGKELDRDMDGNNYDYGFRIYNPQIGRFLSTDPLFKTFAMFTPYQFASNTPIAAIDLDGLEARIAIYGAGIQRDANGNISERHEPQFKSEADKDVKQKNATISLSVHTGDKLVQTLREYTSSEGSIEYVSIASHSGPSGIILDNGQYGLHVVGHPSTANWTNSLSSKYTSTDIDNIINNEDIKFASNALVVFAGCNAGRTVSFDDDKTPIYSVAKNFTEKSGVASIGAYGNTAPTGKGGNRKADNDYRLFYKDENGVLQQTSLGKELSQEAIDKAKNIVNEVAKKIEEKNAKPVNNTPEDN